MVKDYQLLLRKLLFGLNSFTGGLVVLLGCWIFISALYFEPAHLGTSASYRAIASVPEALQKRTTASLVVGDKAASRELQPIQPMGKISVGCWEDAFKTASGARESRVATKQIQLIGRLCRYSSLNTHATHIVNRTTGTEFTLFHLPQGKLMTDYVSLAPGENQIMVELVSENGTRVVTDFRITYSI